MQSLLPAHSCTPCWRTALGPQSPLSWKCLGGPALPSRWDTIPLPVPSLAPPTTSPSLELAPSTSQVLRNPWLRLCFSRTPSRQGQRLLQAGGGPSQMGGLALAFESDLEQQGLQAAGLRRTCVAWQCTHFLRSRGGPRHLHFSLSHTGLETQIPQPTCLCEA